MFYKILNIVMFALMVIMNYLANALPLNNKTTGEISAQFSNLFVPAGITFSIWGVIYLLLLVFVVIQFSEWGRSFAGLIGWAFALSCLLNAIWIVAWHYEQLPLSLILIVGLLATLLLINSRLSTLPGGIFLKATFGIYLGWMFIAVIANLTALMSGYNLSLPGVSDEAWAIIMISIGTIISVIAIMRLQNPFIALAVIWAFAGIIIKRQADYLSIVIAAIAGIVVTVVFTILLLKNAGLYLKG